jgi:ABC-type dipeptide/oligopeptide/nickel transport system permease component
MIRMSGFEEFVGRCGALFYLILSRFWAALPSVVGVIVVTFLLTRALPGDPAAYFAGPAATPETIADIRHQLGFDRSLPIQFVDYVGDLARGNLGDSLTTGQPVVKELLSRLPASAELTLFALAISVMIAVPLGMLAAIRPGSWIDYSCRLISTAGVSLPTFFTGLLFIYIFYVVLDWAPPPLGRLGVFTSPPPAHTGFYLIDSLIAGNLGLFWAAFKQLLMPGLALGFFALAPLARITRASMLGALSSDFVNTARASGLSPSRIVIVYAFGNAVLPVVTTLGMVFSFLLGANVLIEKVFAWPGVGSYAIDALVASDYAPVQGFVLLMACLYIALNLVVDLAYSLLDPRIGISA